MMLNKTRLIRSGMLREGVDPEAVVMQSVCKPITICFNSNIDGNIKKSICDGFKMFDVHKMSYNVIGLDQRKFHFSVAF